MRRGRQKQRNASGSSDTKSCNSSKSSSPCQSPSFNLTRNQHKPQLTETIYNLTTRTKIDTNMDSKQNADDMSLSMELPKENEHTTTTTTKITSSAAVDQTIPQQRLPATHITQIRRHLLSTTTGRATATSTETLNILHKSQQQQQQHKQQATITAITAKLALGATTHRVSLLNLFFFILCVGSLGFTLYCNVRQTRLERELSHVLKLEDRLRLAEEKLFLIMPTVDDVNARQERDLHRLKRDISQLQMTRRQHKRRQALVNEEELTKSTECGCTVGEFPFFFLSFSILEPAEH